MCALIAVFGVTGANIFADSNIAYITIRQFAAILFCCLPSSPIPCHFPYLLALLEKRQELGYQFLDIAIGGCLCQMMAVLLGERMMQVIFEVEFAELAIVRGRHKLIIPLDNKPHTCSIDFSCAF